jgi:hypothetical protein
MVQAGRTLRSRLAALCARAAVVLVLLAWISALVSGARADADARTREEARMHYEAGARLYASAQYLDAVQEFERAYALSGAKPLLFNIAQAYRLVGPAHCERALDAYARYLAADPHAENRAEVKERIGSMRTCVEAQRRERARQAQDTQRAQAPVSARPERITPAAQAARLDQPHTPRPSRVAPLSLIVGGSLVALGCVALYTLARSEYEQAESSCPCPEGKYARWERVTRASYGLAAVGSASLASGLVWLGALRTSRYSLGIAPWRVKFTGRF